MQHPDSSWRREPFWWMGPVEFLGHVVGGLLIFGTIAAAAVLIDVAVQQLAMLGVSSIILKGLTLAEFALFGVDLVLFLIFIIRAAFRLLGRI